MAVDVILANVQLDGSLDGVALARRIRCRHDTIDVILISGPDRIADKVGDLCKSGPLEKP